MSWTYTGNPADSDRDAVRFLIGDTNCESKLASDQEIEFALGVSPIVQKAAAVVCRAIAARFSTKTSFGAGDMSKSCSDIAKAFADRAKELEADGNWKASFVGITLGGRKIATKEALDDDTSIVQPGFKKGMLDNPRAYQDSDNE